MQNLASNPKMSCKMMTDVTIIMGFLNFSMKDFIMAIFFLFFWVIANATFAPEMCFEDPHRQN